MRNSANSTKSLIGMPPLSIFKKKEVCMCVFPRLIPQLPDSALTASKKNEKRRARTVKVEKKARQKGDEK